MKKAFKYLAAGALALTTAGMAQAVPIHFIGSTAFRAATENGIIDFLGGSPQVAYVGASGLAKSSQVAFHGTNGGTTYDIICDWTGSVGGLQQVVNNSGPVQWLNVASWTGISTATHVGAAAPTGGTQITSPTFDTTTQAEVAMSDTYPGTVGVTPSGSFSVDDIGIIPFQWVKINGAPASISNLTKEEVHGILDQGGIPLSAFSNDVMNDGGTVVRAFGRNSDSGTRALALSENYLTASSPIVQYTPTIVSGVVTSVAQNATSNDGFSSGGDLATAMGATGSDTASGNPGWVVAYLGVSDAANAILGGAVALDYEGVSYSPASVANGSYAFWGKEHVVFDHTQSYATAVGLIETQIATNATASGISLNDMNVDRTDDSGIILY